MAAPARIDGRIVVDVTPGQGTLETPCPREGTLAQRVSANLSGAGGGGLAFQPAVP